MRLVIYGLMILFPVLLSDAARAQYFFSGSERQPTICLHHDDKSSRTFQLYWMSGDTPSTSPVAGVYQETGDALCFTPLYPLAAGERFLLRGAAYRDTIINSGSPVVTAPQNAAVTAIYPLSDVVPENILFFHVRFSTPMEEDRDAWKKVHLIDETGTVIPLTWRQRSFWLDSGKLLVLMIHPGRVKTGIRYAGPVFQSGKRYTLMVDSTLRDRYGHTLQHAAIHIYTAVAALKERLYPCALPRKVRSGSRDAIRLEFCNGVDHAAAVSSIRVYDASGDLLPCTIAQMNNHMEVAILPLDHWPEGKLRLELAGSLYDCAGNRMNRLFEMKHKRLFKKDNRSQYFTIRSL